MWHTSSVPEARLGLLCLLKSFPYLGRFPAPASIPASIVAFLAQHAGLSPPTLSGYPKRTRVRHQIEIRRYLGVQAWNATEAALATETMQRIVSGRAVSSSRCAMAVPFEQTNAVPREKPLFRGVWREGFNWDSLQRSIAGYRSPISMLDLFHTLQGLQSWDVSLVAQTGLQFDLRSAQGKLIASLMAELAEFERDLLRERVRSGIAAVRKRGVVFGRRPGQRVKADRFAQKVLKLVGDGQSYREISHRLGLSKNTVLGCIYQ